MIGSKTKNYWLLWEISLLFILSTSTIWSPHWLVLIVTRFFVGLVKVVERKHSPWNPNDLISFDLSWSKASLKILHSGPVRTALLPNRSRYHTQPLRESDPLCSAGHLSWCAQTSHRLEGFPLLILSRF